LQRAHLQYVVLSSSFLFSSRKQATVAAVEEEYWNMEFGVHSVVSQKLHTTSIRRKVPASNRHSRSHVSAHVTLAGDQMSEEAANNRILYMLYIPRLTRWAFSWYKHIGLYESLLKSVVECDIQIP